MTDPRTPTSDPVAEPQTKTGRMVASSERVAMAAALYEAKIPCDSGEDVDRLMDILLRRGFVLALDDGSGLFSDKIVAAIEAEARAEAPPMNVEALAEAVFRVGSGYRRRETADIVPMDWNSQDGARRSGLFATEVAAEYHRLLAALASPGSGLREAAERVIDWDDHHEQWNPAGDFAALRAALGRRRPEGGEPVGPRYYAFAARPDGASDD